jgi:hypothetical protein
MNIYEAIDKIQAWMIEKNEMPESAALTPPDILSLSSSRPRDPEKRATQRRCRLIVNRAKEVIELQRQKTQALCEYTSRDTMRELSPLARFRKGLLRLQ